VIEAADSSPDHIFRIVLCKDQLIAVLPRESQAYSLELEYSAIFCVWAF